MISIVVPVYNAASHVQRSLESITQQEGDIEVVVVDDASTDGSLAVVRSFATDHPKLPLTIVEHTRNQGLGIARRSGFSATTGDFVYFLDSDDHLAPGAVAAMERATCSEGADHTVYVFDFMIGTAESGWRRAAGSRDDTLVGAEAIVEALLRSQLSPFMWNKLYPRALLDEQQFSPLRRGEDVPTLMEVAHVARRVERIPQAIHHYHQAPSSLSKGAEGLAAVADFQTGIAATVREILTRHGTFDRLRGVYEEVWLPVIMFNMTVVLARTSPSGREFRRRSRPVVTGLPPAHLIRGTLNGNARQCIGLAVARVTPVAFRRLVILGRGRPTSAGEERRAA